MSASTGIIGRFSRCNIFARASIFGLALTLLFIPAVAFADDCNGNIDLSYTAGSPNYAIEGSIYRVRAVLYTGNITGGTKLTVNRFHFQLDCNSDFALGIPCTDEGDLVRWVNDATISVISGCKDGQPTPAAVTFTTNGSDNAAGTNDVIFTPSSPVVIPANTPEGSGCTIEFDVRVENTPSIDSTPSFIEQTLGYRIADSDAVCDTSASLKSGASQTSSIELCPVCDDSNLCTVDTCSTSTGLCDYNDTVTPTCDDSNLCTTDFCDSTTGLCDYEDTVTPTCDDGLCEVCDSTTGTCEVDETDERCLGDEICRTPGFWGARGGDEKDGQNITQTVLGSGFWICGETAGTGINITNTDVNDPESAIEAICINKGDTEAKLIRNLTSTGLNCNLGTCSANTLALWAECNISCFNGDESEMLWCSSQLDCFNNGGFVKSDGSCVPAGVSECSESGWTGCVTNADCDLDTYPDEKCMTYPNCHEDANLCDGNFPDICPPGPASSPKKCNDARKNTGYIWELPQ